MKKSITIVALLLAALTSMAQVPQTLSYQGRLSASGTNFSGNGSFKFALVSAGVNYNRPATATAAVMNGFVISINLLDGGVGYTSAPTVTILDATGSNAIAVASLTDDAVTSVTVQSAGANYSGFPTVTFGTPPPNLVSETYWSNDGTSLSGAEPGSAVIVPVVNGLFTVLLGDTGLTNMTAIGSGVFSNEDTRLRIWFSDGTSPFVALAPDQPLGSVGYARMAAQVPTAAITGGMLGDFAITANKIASGAITTSKLANSAITTAVLADNSVTSQKIVDGTISTMDIQDNSITAADIAASAVSTSELADSSVTAAKIASSAISSSHIQADSISSVHIASGAVSTLELSDSSVTSQKIADGTISTIDIQDNSITAADIAASAITVSELGDGSVNTAKIVDGSINSAKIADGSIAPADMNVSIFNTTFWRVDGNSGTTPGTHFLGTTDNKSLQLRVNNLAVLRLEPNSMTPTIIGGSSANFVPSGVPGVTISGGGMSGTGPNISTANFSTIGGGLSHIIETNSSHAAIGGGWSNSVMTYAVGGVIAGGFGNAIQANTDYGTIAGGSRNVLGQDSDYSIITGGRNNRIETRGGSISGGEANVIASNCWNSAIAGGIYNTISADSQFAGILGGYNGMIGTNSDYSIIAGGNANYIGPDSTGTLISGGTQNQIFTNCDNGTISGGYQNTVTAGGGTIPGGLYNSAGSLAFAAGYRAKANHQGSFVWADYGQEMVSTNDNSVTMRARGGYRLFSNNDATIGTFLAPGSGSWTSMSDRNSKENFAPVDPQGVLEKVTALSLNTWNYKSQKPEIRHIGPVAQDFKAAFGVGETETGITSVDADGVALAAIQGLNQKLEQTLKAKDARISELEQRLNQLESLLRQNREPVR